MFNGQDLTDWVKTDLTDQGFNSNFLVAIFCSGSTHASIPSMSLN